MLVLSVFLVVGFAVVVVVVVVVVGVGVVAVACPLLLLLRSRMIEVPAGCSLKSRVRRL